MSAPLPFTVKVPLLKLALPAMAGEPMSVSLQPEGNPVVCGLTVRLTVVACDKLPLVPVMVNVYVFAGVELLVETLRVDDPGALMEVGLKVPAAPVGNPLTLRLTLPTKQPAAPTFTA